jgi:GTP cyclohydrolase I
MFDAEVLTELAPGCVVVDDIYDSGATRRRYPDHHFVALVTKDRADESHLWGMAVERHSWVQFPWEHDDPLKDNEDTVRRQLELIGQDPNREGLIDTPKRYLKAMREMTRGYLLKAEDVLGTTFANDGYDEIVVLRDIEFTSLCEHHLLPFSGTAAVAYLPSERVVGLSKLARLVDMHANRLQIQEQMTIDIQRDIDRVLGSRGTAVVVRAHHSCMGCRGVRKPSASMVTSAMTGMFKDDHRARAEVLTLMGVR